MTASITFNGVLDKITAVGNNLSVLLGTNGVGTLLVWIRPTLATPPSNSAVYNLPCAIGETLAAGNFGLHIGTVTAGSGEAGDKVWAYFYGTAVRKAGATYAKNEWNLVALRWDGTDLSIWCRSESNGITKHTVQPGENPSSLGSILSIGEKITGDEDDAAVLNTVLTDAQLNLIYAGTNVATDFTGCTLNWPLDSVSLGATPDTSGNSRNGTVVGTTTGTQHAPGAAADPNVGSVTSITVDGLVLTWPGGTGGARTVGAYAGGGYYMVAPNADKVTFSAATIDPLTIVDVYVGGVMVDPSDPTKQGFDNRLNAGSTGPGVTYDAGSAQAMPLTVGAYADGTPKTIWFYRGLDAVQSGGANTGCAAIVQITLVASDPGATALKPPGLFVSGGKPQYTTANINYSLYTTRAIPAGSSEPSWNTLLGYLKRPIVAFGNTVTSQYIAPSDLQSPYPPDHANTIGQLLLGMLSDSSLAHTLINRVCQAGMEVHAGVALGCTYGIANGGYGVGYKLLRFFAGQYLNVSAMKSVPSNITYASQSVAYFHEDGVVFVGNADGSFPSGKPLWGQISSSVYPGSGSGVGIAYGANHAVRTSTQVEIGGTLTREPHWITFLSGTAQAGGASSITLAAGAAGVGDGDRIYIVSGPGTGETNAVAVSGWNNGTKVATLVNAWSTPPTSASTYEVYQGGGYEEVTGYVYAALGIAVVMAGEGANAQISAPWINFIKNRWIAEDGKLNPRYSPSPIAPTQSTSNGRRFNDVDGTWTKKFYDTYASALWPVAGGLLRVKALSGGTQNLDGLN